MNLFAGVKTSMGQCPMEGGTSETGKSEMEGTFCNGRHVAPIGKAEISAH